MQNLIRLKEAIKKLKETKAITTQADIAEHLGYKRPQTISDMATGKAAITTKFVSAFITRYGISREWWNTGNGDVFTATDTHSTVNDASNIYVDTLNRPEFPTIDEGRKKVPLFEAQASAGGNHAIELAPVTQPTQYIELGDMLRNDSQAALYIFGNSMTPNYPSGCIVGLRLSTDGIIQPGEVYVVETDDSRYLKRLYNNEDQSAYECYSDNTMTFETGPKKGHYMYPLFTIHKDRVRRLFIVTGVIKRNTNSAVLAKAS